jgi:hypothetical protein
VRASVQSFQRALKDIRARLKASADKDLIDRWHERAEGWPAIHAHAPDLKPEDLIDQVISERRKVEESVERLLGVPADRSEQPITGFKGTWATVLSILKKQERRTRNLLPALLRAAPSSPDPIKAAPKVEWLVHELDRAEREFERAARKIRQAAVHLRLVHRNYVGAPNRVLLPRQGARNERARNAFVERMSKFLREHTGREILGKELLGEIAVLADIAFPGGGEPDPESIARSQRRKRSKP